MARVRTFTRCFATSVRVSSTRLRHTDTFSLFCLSIFSTAAFHVDNFFGCTSSAMSCSASSLRSVARSRFSSRAWTVPSPVALDSASLPLHGLGKDNHDTVCEARSTLLLLQCTSQRYEHRLLQFSNVGFRLQHMLLQHVLDITLPLAKAPAFSLNKLHLCSLLLRRVLSAKALSVADKWVRVSTPDGRERGSHCHTHRFPRCVRVDFLRMPEPSVGEPAADSGPLFVSSPLVAIVKRGNFNVGQSAVPRSRLPTRQWPGDLLASDVWPCCVARNVPAPVHTAPPRASCRPQRVTARPVCFVLAANAIPQASSTRVRNFVMIR